MAKAARMARWALATLAALTLLVSLAGPAGACSTAIATGSSTVDGRPVVWKNRDNSLTVDCWRSIVCRHTATGGSFGSGDRYTDRFNYVALTATDSVDPVTGEHYPWMGVNERGLGLVSAACHNLANDVVAARGYPVSQDTNGANNGVLNMWVLSRCEHVDEVEQLLRDTNNGGGYNNSYARNTNTILMAIDRWGNAATFEADGDSFTRDNVTRTYAQDGEGYYAQTHDDDKDTANPPDGGYNGFDWRANFSRVTWTKPNGFPYFVDDYVNEIVGDQVVLTGDRGDGIHDWEDSTSAVMRWNRIGIRMDDNHLK
ncbi:MAG: hypothetical protein K6T75_09025, partial [Acetobacteraceae bacterium]|nr:hypothetical protein [Acetobacteraceae bacterium]